MKLDKSKRTILAILCLYLALGIIAVLVYAAFGAKFSRNADDVDYTFSDSGKAGDPLEISSVAVLGESGAKEETEEVEEPIEEVSVVEETPEESVIPEKQFYSFVVTTKVDRLRIRKEPSEEAKILGHFNKQDAGYILIKGNEWSYVTDGKKTGYCFNEYMEMTEIPIEELPDFYPEEYKTLSDEEINY